MGGIKRTNYTVRTSVLALMSLGQSSISRELFQKVIRHFVHSEMPMAILATLLSRFERQTVIDATGLSGSFAVDLKWITEAARGVNQQGAAAPVSGLPTDVWLSTALQEQLGLQLESRDGPLDVLVVDNAEKVPADN